MLKAKNVRTIMLHMGAKLCSRSQIMGTHLSSGDKLNHDIFVFITFLVEVKIRVEVQLVVVMIKVMVSLQGINASTCVFLLNHKKLCVCHTHNTFW